MQGDILMKIGFFDSGIGGITVLREAIRCMPNESYIYYADTEHVPYGTKNKNEVREYVFNAAEFLAQNGIKMLVVACNTATSLAIKDLRQKYHFPIVGMEPAVKPAVEISLNKDKRVLVLATPITLSEDKFKNLVLRVDSEHIVDYIAVPELVEFAEKFEFETKEVKDFLINKLKDYDMSRYGTVVLGCTHFVYYKDVFRNILPKNIDIIDGNAGTVRNIMNILCEKNIKNNSNVRGSIEFYLSERIIEEPDLLKKYKCLAEGKLCNIR